MYRRRHDGTIPSKDDTNVPFRQVLVWALLTSVVAAMVDVAVQQGMARWAEKPQPELPA